MKKHFWKNLWHRAFRRKPERVQVMGVMNEEFRCICGWCDLVIREGNTSRTSHTICDPCAAKHFPGVDLGAKLEAAAEVAA